MGLAPWKCFREQNNKPYPKSKYNRSVPDSKLSIKNTGNRKATADQFPIAFKIVSLSKCRISSEAFEAARIAANKVMVKNAGKTEYHLEMKKECHEAIRFNKVLSCAGADRIGSGMRKAFGKCIRKAACVANNDELMQIRSTKKHEKAITEALKQAATKLPCGIDIIESQKWGFTKINRDEYPQMRENSQIALMGSNVAILNEKGPLSDKFEKMLTIKKPTVKLPQLRNDSKSSDLNRPFKKFNLVLAA